MTNKSEYKTSKDSLLQISISNQNKTLVEDDLRNLYFGDFIRTKETTTSALKTYEEINNLEKLKQVRSLLFKLKFYFVILVNLFLNLI